MRNERSQNNLGGFNPTITNPVTNTLGSFLLPARTVRPLNRSRQRPGDASPGIAWQASDKWASYGRSRPIRRPPWSMDTVGGPLGFGTGVTGTLSANPGDPPAIQLSGTGAGLPIIAGRDPATYITPANPQGNGFNTLTPYNLPIMNGWQWTGKRAAAVAG